jgi:hypothetical protein
MSRGLHRLLRIDADTLASADGSGRIEMVVGRVGIEPTTKGL